MKYEEKKKKKAGRGIENASDRPFQSSRKIHSGQCKLTIKRCDCFGCLPPACTGTRTLQPKGTFNLYLEMDIVPTQA